MKIKIFIILVLFSCLVHTGSDRVRERWDARCLDGHSRRFISRTYGDLGTSALLLFILWKKCKRLSHLLLAAFVDGSSPAVSGPVSWGIVGLRIVCKILRVGWVVCNDVWSQKSWFAVQNSLSSSNSNNLKGYYEKTYNNIPNHLTIILVCYTRQTKRCC